MFSFFIFPVDYSISKPRLFIQYHETSLLETDFTVLVTYDNSNEINVIAARILNGKEKLFFDKPRVIITLLFDESIFLKFNSGRSIIIKEVIFTEIVLERKEKSLGNCIFSSYN